MSKLRARSVFLLGAAAGVGAILALAVTAFGSSPAGPKNSTSTSGAEAPSSAPLAVFERPTASPDQLSAELAASVQGLEGTAGEISESLRPGRLVLGESRLLQMRLGGHSATLYAFPSRKGRICYALSTGAQSCVTDFTASDPISWSIVDYDGYGRGEPTAVFGLVPNNVITVDAVVGGSSLSAEVLNNSYFIEMRDGTTLPSALTAHFRDGKVTSVDLPRLGPLP